MSKYLFFLLGGLAFGGQSIQLSTATAGNASVPAQTPGNPWRVEFSIHNWSTTFSGVQRPADGSAVGANIQFFNFGGGDLRLQIYSSSSAGGSVCQIAGLGPGGPNGGSSIYTNLFLTVRYQEDPVAKIDYCQGWDINGNLVWNQASPYSNNPSPNSGGATVAGLGSGQNLDTAYLRIYTSTVATNARPPVTADTTSTCLVFWKFDLGNNTGSLNDSCPAGPYNATMSSGTPVYVSTPGQNLVVPVLQTRNAPAWGNGSLRAGFPAQLDGTASYSQADGSASVSCFWQALSGPPALLWDNHASCSPALEGLSFGDYNFQLAVTDVNGSQATAKLDVGAVATDSNGVVISSNPTVDALFGPLIALGQNPWGYQDYWALHAMTLRAADYAATQTVQGLTYPGWSTNGKPQWEAPGQGTVSYYFNGVGNLYYLNGSLGTVLNGSLSATATSLTVTSAAGLDLSSLPTRIEVFDGTNWDELRVCSATGNTLNLCYDPSPLPRHSFVSGTNVLQSKVTGTGTKFVSDPTSPICPVGAPGLPGLSSYSGGTISLAAGSTIAVVSAGTWTGFGVDTRGVLTTGNLLAGNFLQVSATHGGAPFNFMAQNTTGGAAAIAALSAGAISSVAPAYSLLGQNYVSGQVNVLVTDSTGSGANITANVVGGQIATYTVNSGGSNYSNPILAIAPVQIALARAFPSDADTSGGLSYHVMPATRTLVLHYKNAYTDPTYDSTGDSMQLFGATGCESETSVFINAAGGANNGLGNQFAALHDVTGIDGAHFTGQPYSVTDTTGWVNQSSTGGINFYGEDVASRALYLRSGLNAAKTAAQVIGNYWLHSPWGNADGNGYPRLFLGGGGIGAWISYLTDPSSLVSISNLRGYAQLGAGFVTGIASAGCNSFDDTRDTGYAYTFLILGALYDPDTTSSAAPGGLSWRAYWQSFLSQMRANDTACANPEYSWANGFLWNANFPVLTLTNGSAVATGTGIPANMCNGTASGTATLTNGVNGITVLTGIIPAGTTDLFLTGTTGSGASVFVQSLAYGNGVLGGQWLGDSGTVHWVSGTWDGYPGNGIPFSMMTIATSEDDLTDLKKDWACTWNSSTSITLNRAWDGASTDGSHVYHPYVANLAGYGQQPFMLGIKSYGMNLLATQTLPALSSYVPPYTAFTRGATSWIWNTGMDHQFFGTNYGRIYQQCEPGNTAPSGTNFTFRAPGCTYGANVAGVFLSTEQNSETGAAHTIYYANNPTTANQMLGDQFYGSLWGYCPWTTGVVYCSANSTSANAAQTNLADPSIHGGKWDGFFTGMGMSARWPAVRLGGVQAPRPRTVYISVRAADVAGAASVTVVVTAPSGAQTTFACSSEPCAITVDDRQGAHTYRIQYLATGGAVLSQSQPALLVSE